MKKSPKKVKPCPAKITERGEVVVSCDLPDGHEGQHHGFEGPYQVDGGILRTEVWFGQSRDRGPGACWVAKDGKVYR